MSANSPSVERPITDEPPSLAVVLAVSAALDADPDQLDPLYDAVDPDALDRIFQQGTVGHVNFEWAGCEVVITGDSTVLVTRPDAVWHDERTPDSE